MALSRSPFVPADVADPELRFVWDDTRASDDFAYDPTDVLAKLKPTFLRARVSVAIGMYEWILWRLQPFCDDRTPIDTAEAAWCANIDRRYMNYFELDRNDWLGPVRGPLWCATTWLLPMIFFSDERPEEAESGLAYLSCLAMHVLPDPESFERWVYGCIDRLTSLYSAPPDDPFSDVFGDMAEESRGPLVPREALDLARPYSPDTATIMLAEFLGRVDYNLNPYLRSPEEMTEDEFEGTPYQL